MLIHKDSNFRWDGYWLMPKNYSPSRRDIKSRVHNIGLSYFESDNWVTAYKITPIKTMIENNHRRRLMNTIL